MVEFVLLVVIFFAIELLYFKVADYFNIIDKPNERSSHTQLTIRGGGVLFPIAWLLYSILNGFIFPWATIGLLAIAVVSFADDRMELSKRLRFAIHLFAFTMCFIQLNLFHVLPLWLIPVVYVVGIGCVNAVNFMDGINGMTGLYSLAVLIPIQWLFYKQWWNGSLVNYLMLASLVFGYFNFRKKARCFAGDVGSVSMGYILVFLILGLMFDLFAPYNQKPWLGISLSTQFKFHLQFLLLLTMYGLDAILTLFQRLFLKHNIFEAHRMHLYQLLCNEFKMPHLLVSFFYALIQLVIGFYLIHYVLRSIDVLYFLLISTLLYSLIKTRLIKFKKISYPQGKTIKA